jgi:hypothetical protein
MLISAKVVYYSKMVSKEKYPEKWLLNMASTLAIFLYDAGV